MFNYDVYVFGNCLDKDLPDHRLLWCQNYFILALPENHGFICNWYLLISPRSILFFFYHDTKILTNINYVYMHPNDPLVIGLIPQ